MDRSTPCLTPRLFDNKTLLGVKVLVVDDSADMRLLVSTILRKFGAETKMSESVDSALIEIDQFKPDVIVSDISMPEKTGLDLMRTLRHEIEKPGTQKTPAIAVSAFGDQFSKQQSLNEGFQVHLSKPIDRQRLVELVSVLAELDGKAVEGGLQFQA